MQFGAVSPTPQRNVPAVFKAAPVANPPLPVIAVKVPVAPGIKLKVPAVAFGPIVGVIIALAYCPSTSVTTYRTGVETTPKNVASGSKITLEPERV